MQINPNTRRWAGAARRLLRRTGFDVVRVQRRNPRRTGPSYDSARGIPPGAREWLRPDNPRLLELRNEYAAVALPMAVQTRWSPAFLSRELELGYFRGDNAYLWQFREYGPSAEEKHYFYMRDLFQRDERGLFDRLTEDGAFGCWTFEFPGWPVVSRDLLDSINELHFLDRHIGLLGSSGLRVLDVGAGYGRLAHRMLAAVPALEEYVCVDAVPESTFLCEFYLRYRECGERAKVVALHELDAALSTRRFDLVVNIHSFSEMSTAAVEGWMARIARSGARWLLVVPNDPEGTLAIEADASRRNVDALIESYGFQLKVREPIFLDPTLRRFMGRQEFFLLFERA